MFKYKINVMEELKNKGYSSYRLRQEHILGESMLQKIRVGDLPSWSAAETLCKLLELDIGDILTYVPDDD